MSAEIRTDDVLTTADPDDVVTPGEAFKLHDWVEGGLPNDGEPITVAIMDSGIEIDNEHPWFRHTKVTYREDYTGSDPQKDDVGHGTAVASVYGAAAANVLAEATGVEYPIHLESHRIFGNSGRSGIDAITKAYQHLTERADKIDIVNMSWGARQNVQAINVLHEKLIANGVHDVVAAGNTGNDGGSPATAERAFSAGATNEEGDMTRFSSTDPNLKNPDVAAIGKNVKLARSPGTSMGTPINDDFTKASGTSFAAPYTGAAYAIGLWVKNESWDRRFKSHSADIPGTRRDGAGLLKLDPSIDGDAPEPMDPKTSATVYKLFGTDLALINADWLPTSVTEAVKTGEEKDSIDVRFEE